MKYFVLSDIHSFYKEMKVALKKAGFSRTNPEHCLVVIGDIFDRGPDTMEVFHFLHDIPKQRRVMIRGNHEILFLNLLNKAVPDYYDFSNGTVKTFCHIAGVPEYEVDILRYYIGLEDEVFIKAREYWKNIKSIVAHHPVTRWLRSKEWKNYWELDRFIFTHSFIPTSYLHLYNLDWRDAPQSDWSQAVWGCPWEQYQQGFFEKEEKKGKTLVVGHWYTADFFYHLKNRTVSIPSPIYYSKGLIGIDGGCCQIAGELVHPQQVLVIDEEFNCFDGEGKALVECEELPRIETVMIDEKSS